MSHASKALVLACLAAMPLLGCATQPTHKEAATSRWIDARAGVFAQLATDQLDNGQLAEAKDAVEKGLAVNTDRADLWLLSARISIEQDDLTAAKQALEACEVSKASEDERAKMHHLKGVVAERWNKTTEAADHYLAAANLVPSDATFLVAASEALVGDGRPEEAATMLSQAVASFQGNAAVFDAYGQVLSLLNRHVEAADAFHAASVFAPEDVDLRERRALSLLAANQPAAAATALERLVVQPDAAERPSLRVALGQARLLTGDAVGAEAAFREAVRLERRSFAAWAGVAKALLDQGEPAAAVPAAERAAALAEADQRIEADLLRGLVFFRAGDFRRAAAGLHEMAEANDPSAVALYGLCLKALGDEAGALACLERANRSPDFAAAMTGVID
jgi:tetratricopeptide (TPR) repeat protein